VKIVLLSLFGFLCGYSAMAQDPSITWQNTVGGGNWDNLWALAETQDGGFVGGGWSASNISGDKTENSNGGADFWVIKLDAEGNLLWQNTIGGAGDDFLYSLFETDNGDFILGGKSNSDSSGDKTEDSNGSFDYWIVRIDSEGNVLSDLTIGGADHDHLWHIGEGHNGNYILGGYSRSDISGDKTENSRGGFDYWIMELTSAGTIVWQKTLGGSLFDELKQIVPTNDGGYLMGGDSESGVSGDKIEDSRGGLDHWIIKTDGTGNIEWQRTLGGNDDDDFGALIQTSEGDFLVGGYSVSNASGEKSEDSRGVDDYWILKLSPSGDLLWDRTYGGDQIDRLFTMAETSIGTYLLGGYAASGISGDKTEAGNGGPDYWLIELDESGSLLRQNGIGGFIADIMTDMSTTSDGGLILGGYSYSDISGDKSEDSNGFWDFWMVKLGDVLDVPDNAAAPNVSIYPNPTRTILRVQDSRNSMEIIHIYAATGELLMEISPESSFQAEIDVSSLKTALYFIKITSDGHTQTKNFVKI